MKEELTYSLWGEENFWNAIYNVSLEFYVGSYSSLLCTAFLLSVSG